MDYKALIAQRIKEHVDLEFNLIERLIEIPPRPEMGDFAFPCFQLSKVLRKAPNMIASDLKDKINKEGFEKVENLGPYLNFFMDKASFIKEILEKVQAEGDKYGSSKIGEGKNVIVEYSSPNIAKNFHVGHLTTTVIGNSLYRMMNFEGYKAIGVNHLGDWGTQYGRLIAAYHRWVDKEALQKNAIRELERLYVKFYDEAEKDPSLEDVARKHFKNLEDGCEEEVKLWNEFKELSLKEFKRVYDMLNVNFDSYAGESFYSDKMDAVVEEIELKGLLTESNGAKVVMLDEYNMPPCIIKKSDGATIYATRDLAAAFYRKKTYDFYKNIYVVGSSQALHFKQVFTTIKLMGYDWADDCKHVGFGLVKFAEGKFSTRSGNAIYLEELLNEAVVKALEVINEKNPNLENKEEVAKKIGIGSIVFTYLKNNREKDIIFDWKEMLNFEGETGPYVQYTYARGRSILRKAGEVTGSINYSKITSAEEFELVKLISRFQDVVLFAIDKLEPSIVTRHIIEISKAFNKFYNAHSILNSEDEEVKNTRLKLVEAACQVIKNGLYIIGIDVVEKM
ncbi:arginine--tRNA ligase [Clostridium sp. SYSU_GA19001]|uniref:arginine--tRNA ligase n=1 Tax=Clostridium caldaquaticum TaxID=2940653 RepID=UPI002077714B|nr:arginine--tRNA ligase [Clostridium caldaquaticum]MCM8711673.1 arginine--tRNA ligase [Clostridium caldaquaticum]